MSPRWALAPLSGAGAARQGGRWNRPGQEALYLSLEMETAFADYDQDLARPGTLCAFDVELGPVLDLRDGAAWQALGALTAELLCPWKTIWLIRKTDSPTWRIADQLIAAGVAGALVPSAQRMGGTNLVLWRWNDDPARKVAAFDPQGDLPRNQDSWT